MTITTAVATDPLFRIDTVRALRQDDLIRTATQTSACAHVRGFLGPGLCARLVGLIDMMPLGSVDQERVSPPVLRFGPTLNDFALDGRLDSAYWGHVESARSAWAAAGLPYDPMRICLERIGDAWGAPTLPARIQGRGVLAGTIRESNGGLRVHFDEVAREFPNGLFDQNLIAQLAMNVYLTMPEAGGETTIWRRTWTPADEEARIGFGYDQRLVDGVQSVAVRPAPGDALIFNPRFYHAVSPGQGGRRVSVAMFLGLAADGTIAVWS